MTPTEGGSRASAIQIRRMMVTSISKYSAKPAQTPATFFPSRTRWSRRLGKSDSGPGAPGTPESGFPQLVQNWAVSASCTPQRVQYMSIIVPESGELALEIFELVFEVGEFLA